MSRTICLLMLLLCIAPIAQGQERSLVRKGNELYAAGKYAEATKAYQEAQQKSPGFTPGAFNLGAALIQQKQNEAARKAFANAAKSSKDPTVQSGAHYNTGNTYISEQQWQQALDAYKAALRRNPEDADARYNYSYALAKLRQQQQQQNGGGGSNKKDEQKKDENKDNGQKNGDKKEQQRQPKPSTLTEQQADNLLKALQQEERKAQDKMQQDKASPVRMEKDW